MGIHPREITYVDASTELGKLIELLAPKEERIFIPNVGDYNAEISGDKKTVKVGCQTVTREKVEEIYEAMFN